ncbi:hypothetical protein AcV7_006181 [Taiwanofungus camphoratus]|nr:hypothetical protein AcV7_006181 [Antrodia cinnamomea]
MAKHRNGHGRHSRKTRIASSKASSEEDFNLDVSGGSESSRREMMQSKNPQPHPRGHLDSAAATATGSVADSEPTPPSSRSAAHDINFFFEKVAPRDRNDKTKRTVCKLCKQSHESTLSTWPESRRYTFSTSTSNTSLRVHLERYHEDIYLSKCTEFGWLMQLPKRREREKEAKALSVKAEQLAAINQSGVSRGLFSLSEFHQHLIRFIVADDQSLNVVQCPEFRSLLLYLREDLQEKDIPRRTKVRELIIKAWKIGFDMLKDDLTHAIGKISFTLDIWSDQRRRPYLCLTGHWIARDKLTKSLLLKAGLLAFHRIFGKHDGKNLAKIVLKLLDRAGVTVKLHC